MVLHFIYTNCPNVCPLHAERLAEIQKMVNQTPMRELAQFVTITTDPEHDTPEVMRQYGSAHGLDPVNWVFLITTPDQPEDATRKLAERFGHGFTETTDGYQIHGVVTHIIDRDGRWQANFHGLEFEPTNLVVYINALVNDAGRPHAPGRRASGRPFVAGSDGASPPSTEAMPRSLSSRRSGPGLALRQSLLVVLVITAAVAACIALSFGWRSVEQAVARIDLSVEGIERIAEAWARGRRSPRSRS